MISIRRRATLLLCSALALLLLGGGALVFWTIQAVLIAQLDANLAAKAQTLIVGADLDEGEIEIDSDLLEFAGFEAREGDNYFEILGADGASPARSPSLGTSHLPVRSSGAELKYGSVKLPDGRSGRAIWRSFSPAEDNRAMPGKLEVVVATYSGDLERSLRNIMHILFAVGLTGLVLAVVIVHFCLKSGLRPLDELAERVRGIGVTHLHERLPTDQLPRELQPIAEKLNEMLKRLEEGFAREQRFSSDAAHELRTPLAELKVMTELVTRWPRSSMGSMARR
ncbi:MAG: HAMP domain-containing protein [Terrimicrobiaceae bacterium]